MDRDTNLTKLRTGIILEPTKSSFVNFDSERGRVGMVARSMPSEIPTGLTIYSDEEIKKFNEDELSEIVDLLNVRLNRIAEDLAIVEKSIGQYLSILSKHHTSTPKQTSAKEDKYRLIEERNTLMEYFEKIRREYRKKTGWDKV